MLCPHCVLYTLLLPWIQHLPGPIHIQGTWTSTIFGHRWYELHIAALIDAHPKIYLDEIQEQLLTAQDVLISVPTLSHALCHMALTNKQVVNAALERNKLLCVTWQAAYADIPAKYCVWLDKASIDDLTNQRTAGWAPKERACICRTAFIHSQQYSVLPALTCNSIIVLDIFEGSINKKRFLQFLNEQLVSAIFW